MIIPPTDEHHDSKEKKPEVSEKPKKPTVSDKHSTPKKEHKVKKTKKAKKNKKVKVAKKHTTSSSRLAKAESKKSAKSSTWSNNRGPKSEWTSNHGPQVNGIIIMKSEFNGADETANNKPKASDEELPQTGEKDNKLGILGLFSVSLASLLD